jgi:hypothetical protein
MILAGTSMLGRTGADSLPRDTLVFTDELTSGWPMIQESRPVHRWAGVNDAS